GRALGVRGWGSDGSGPDPTPNPQPPTPTAVIRVRDTGVGLTPELLSRIFDPFTQADRSLDRSQGGLGIGLTLVRRLAELHGGAVHAHSPGPSHGSEFTVRLPILDFGFWILDCPDKVKSSAASGPSAVA